jgi:hypothetical protein
MMTMTGMKTFVAAFAFSGMMLTLEAVPPPAPPGPESWEFR